MTKHQHRKPGVFAVKDVEIAAAPALQPPPLLTDSVEQLPMLRGGGMPTLRRGLRWGSLLLAAIGGLVGLGAAVWLHDLVRELASRQDWIGFAAVVLLAVAAVALCMMVLKEATGLLRLRRLGRLREEADTAARQDDRPLAADAVRRLKQFYHTRKDLAWGLQRLAVHEDAFLNAGELLRLAERNLVAPLDPLARAIVAASAKRITVVTAVSPVALIDMLFVAAENLRMLRRLATLYGARPGVLSLLKLARMVIAHIVLSGGIAMGDDVLQQLIGHGLTARLSARLGEGMFNGALTTRIGLAAIDVCRPLPYLDVARPRFRELVAEIAGLR